MCDDTVLNVLHRGSHLTFIVLRYDDRVIIPILQRKELRPREVNGHGQGHMTRAY